MKLTCNKNDLSEALQIASKAVASKPQTPILSSIYLHADNNTLELQANNYEIGIIVRIPATIEEPGQICIAGRYLQEVTRKLPGEKVILSCPTEQNTVKIQSNSSNFTLIGIDAFDFPTIQYLTEGFSFTIDAKPLKELIRKTSFACATDESRPVFAGCSLDILDATLTMVATNMHRLAVKTVCLPEHIGETKIIIPSRTLNELIHIVDSSSRVRVFCAPKQISFEFENVYLISRLIEGKFPAYQGVIPKSFETEVTVHTSDLNSAVDRVSLISRANEYNIIRFSFGQGQLHISSNNPEIGNAEEIIPAAISGPDVNIAFNAQYITDVLKNLDSDDCRIALNHSLDATAIHDGDDDTFIYVVTPVRTAH